MPSLGADMDRGTVVEWMVAPGDTVQRGDIVALVETEKGIIEVEIWEDGIIAELLVAEGTEVPVGTPLATLADTDRQAAAAGHQPPRTSRRSREPEVRRRRPLITPSRGHVLRCATSPTSWMSISPRSPVPARTGRSAEAMYAAAARARSAPPELSGAKPGRPKASPRARRWPQTSEVDLAVADRHRRRVVDHRSRRASRPPGSRRRKADAPSPPPHLLLRRGLPIRPFRAEPSRGAGIRTRKRSAAWP